MSLINRIEVSNFLDPGDGEAWRPLFRYEQLRLNCLSSAIVLENGNGKTSLVNAMFAILGRDRTLISETGKRMPPRSVGVYGHVRIEFVIRAPSKVFEGFLADESQQKSGEPWVMGVCGFKGEPLDFYYYQGKLEDVPLAGTSPAGKKILVPNEEFRARLKAIRGEWSPDLRTWREMVSQQGILPQQLRQMLAFQKAGGGDKSSSLFEVKSPGPYHVGFFYEHIAPQLLAGVGEITDEKNEFEDRFEDTVVKSAEKFLGARNTLRDKQKALQAAERSTKALTPAVQAAEEVERRGAALKEVLTQAADTSACMDWLREARIPGLPVWSPSGDQEVNALLEHMVIAPGQGPALRDNGLAELLGKEDKQINRDAEGRGIKPVLSSQPIDFNMYLKMTTGTQDWGGRRYPDKLYPRDSVLAFLDACSPEYLGVEASDTLRKSDLQRLVIKAFDHFAQHMDTSPFRARLGELEKRLKAIDDELRQIAEDEQKARSAKAKAEKDLDLILKDKLFWEEMRAAGLPQEHLDAPGKARPLLETERAEADRKKEQLIRDLANITGNKEQWDRFAAKYGPEADPTEISQGLDLAIQEKGKEIGELTAEAGRLDQARKHKETEAARLKKEFEELTLLRGPWVDFTAMFGPEASPAKVKADLLAEQGQLEKAVADHREGAETAQRKQGEVRAGLVDLAGKQGKAREELKSLEGVQPGAAYIREHFKGKGAEAADVEVRASEDSLRNALREAEAAEAAEKSALAEEKSRIKAEIGQAGERLKSAKAGLEREKKSVAEKRDGLGTVAERIRKSLERSRDGFASRKQTLEEELRTLESRRVAPATVAKAALDRIPKGVGFQCLHEAVMASETSPERKKDLVTRLSGILFSPVLEDVQAALDLALEYDRRKYPVLVFLRKDFDAFIRGEDSGLLKAVRGAETETVEMLLHPEKVEAAKQRLRGRITEHDRSIQALSKALSLVSGDSHAEAGQALRSGLAILDEAAGRDTDLVHQDAEEARRAISGGREELAALGAELQGAQEALALAEAAEQAAAVLAIQVEKDLEALRTSLDSLEATFRAQERQKAAQAVATAKERLGRHLSEFGQGSEYERMLGLCREFERKGGDLKMNALRTELVTIGGSIKAAETLIAELQNTYETAEEARRLAGDQLSEVSSKLGRFDFVKLESFAATGARRLAELESFLAGLEKEVEEIRRMAGDVATRKNTAIEKEGELNRTRNEFDFRALAVFKSTGGGKDLERLQRELDDVKKRLEQLDNWLRLRFSEADRYVRARDQVEPLTRKAQELAKELDAWDEKRTALNTEKAGFDDKMNGLKVASSTYDNALCEIVAEFRQFAKVPPELFAEGHGTGGEGLERLEQVMGDLLEAFAALEDQADGPGQPAKAISEQVKGFEIKNMVTKLKAARDAREKSLSSYRGAVESILADADGFTEIEQSLIRESLAEPIRIRAIQSSFQKIIEQRSADCAEWLAKVESYRGDVETTLAELATAGKSNRDILQRICRKYDKTTFEIDVEVADSERIREGITAIVDLIDARLQHRKASGQEDVRAGSKQRPDESLMQNVRTKLYETIFLNPSVKVRHPQVRGGKLVPFERPPFISLGQKAALDLMMLVRLAEFAQDRGLYSLDPQARKMLRGVEQCFYVIDGLFSSLSKESLIRSALEALRACQGSFQLIGFIHNMSYVNNYDIFPTYLAGKEFTPPEDASSRETWVEFERGDESRIGQIGFFNSTVVAKKGGADDAAA